MNWRKVRSAYGLSVVWCSVAAAAAGDDDDNAVACELNNQVPVNTVF